MFCPKETDSSMSKVYEKISVMAGMEEALYNST